MTATDELRRLLDERRVEWSATTGAAGTIWTHWDAFNGYRVHAMDNGDGTVEIFGEWDVTPAQAIAATLGTGTCHNVNHGLTFVCSECGANVDTASSIGYSYVDEFGKRWYGASNDYGLNYCPNCGRKVVAE